MFRRERPQKGRLRQFHQFGMEALGSVEPYPDAEQLIIISGIFEKLGIADDIYLEINYLGSRTTRSDYAKALKAYYKPHKHRMTDLDARRLEDNTLRLLDSKDEIMLEINQGAPLIQEHYCKEEIDSFNEIQKICEGHRIKFNVNQRLMRGLDYYTGLIYEWKSDKLGAQSTICGGGRYDLLFENIGQKAQPACGFSIGIERLLELVKDREYLTKKMVIVMAALSKSEMDYAMLQSERIRSDCPNIKIHTHFECGKIATVIKKALKRNATYLILCGEDEKEKNLFTMKNLKTKEQSCVDYQDLIEKIRRHND